MRLKEMFVMSLVCVIVFCGCQEEQTSPTVDTSEVGFEPARGVP